MSKSKNDLLSKFLETEEFFAEANELGGLGLEAKAKRIDEASLSVADLIKHNSNKQYASNNMAEEFVRWKSKYNQEIHEGEFSNPREVRLERLVKWINPNSQLMFEFENHESRKIFDKMENRIFNLVKHEFFGFLNFGTLDTYITIGEDVFISRYIEKDLLITRDRLLIELDFLKSENAKYSDVEYYERYAEIRDKDILVIGIKINNEKYIKKTIDTKTDLSSKATKSFKVRSIRRKPVINV
jgi:hypothetical protein